VDQPTVTVAPVSEILRVRHSFGIRLGARWDGSRSRNTDVDSYVAHASERRRRGRIWCTSRIPTSFQGPSWNAWVTSGSTEWRGKFRVLLVDLPCLSAFRIICDSCPDRTPSRFLRSGRKRGRRQLPRPGARIQATNTCSEGGRRCCAMPPVHCAMRLSHKFSVSTRQTSQVHTPLNQI